MVIEMWNLARLMVERMVLIFRDILNIRDTGLISVEIDSFDRVYLNHMLLLHTVIQKSTIYDNSPCPCLWRYKPIPAYGILLLDSYMVMIQNCNISLVLVRGFYKAEGQVESLNANNWMIYIMVYSTTMGSCFCTTNRICRGAVFI